MKGKRKNTARPAAGGVRSSKRLKNAERQPAEQALQERSVWQEPEHPVLETIFELLLAQPAGKRWVRLDWGPLGSARPRGEGSCQEPHGRAGMALQATAGRGMILSAVLPFCS
jgi:hypothetical protein